MIVAWVLYIIRVMLAWWMIKKIKNIITKMMPGVATWKAFYLSVFIGAEITFIADYFIFSTI